MNNQRGAVTMVVGILLLVLVGFAALAIDIGYRHVTKNELQNAADTAALAAARQLGVIYQGLSPAEQQSYVCDPSTIIPIAQEVVKLNYAAGKTILVDETDVTIGTWDGTSLTPTLNQPDAVRVVASRDDSNPRGAVSTFFAGTFGIEEVSVWAKATAALSGQRETTPGELKLPIGISEAWFEGKEEKGWCGDIIKFSPTKDPAACGGWNTFDKPHANDAEVGKILDKMLNNEMKSPLVRAGKTEFHFTNGNLSANTFKSLMTLYQNRGYDVDRFYTPNSGEPEPVVYIDEKGNLTNAYGTPSKEPVSNGKDPFPLIDPETGEQLLYPNGDPRYAHEWQTTIPVYEDNDCTPGKEMKIKGLAEVVLFDVGMPSNKTVAARLKCKIIVPEPMRGGGGNFGKLGNIPNLVE